MCVCLIEALWHFKNTHTKTLISSHQCTEWVPWGFPCIWLALLEINLEMKYVSITFVWSTLPSLPTSSNPGLFPHILDSSYCFHGHCECRDVHVGNGAPTWGTFWSHFPIFLYNLSFHTCSTKTSHRLSGIMLSWLPGVSLLQTFFPPTCLIVL